MKIRENVPLAPLTTLGVGGSARFFAEARTGADIAEALAFAKELSLTVYPLGNGSNILVPDAGVDGLVLKISLRGISFEEHNDSVLLTGGAGDSWESVVDAACERNVFGIENLAGIPGTLGGAAVQNIGAYGAEFSSVFEYADVIDAATGDARRVSRDEAAFAYRTSYFKEHPNGIITNVALRLEKHGTPHIAYADLVRAQASGIPLGTPSEIVQAVRAIRAAKFPNGTDEGTAGSFFKNPSLTREQSETLAKRYVGLPTYPQENGSVKISLAWILDHVLGLKGHAMNGVRLFEKQPIVIVAGRGVTAEAVNALATDVASRVSAAIGISIEREVETFGAQK